LCFAFLTFSLDFLKDFIYLSEREHKQGEWQAEREAGSLLSREPNVGLHLRTLGS